MNAADRELGALLRRGLGPLAPPSPGEELWPRLERRLSEPRRRVGKLDWLMAALALLLLAGLPEAALLVLYHL